MRTSQLLAIASALSCALYAQQPRFEVASIRPAPPLSYSAGAKMHAGMTADPARVDIGYTSIHELIHIAYDVRRYQIQGPDWMTKDYWDILAKMPAGATVDQVPQMLQALLAERFGLKLHRETRKLPVYALVVAKSGANLQPGSPDGQYEGNQYQVATARDGKMTTTGGGAVTKTEMRPDGSMHIEYSKMTMALLGDTVGYYLDRPVIDATNLSGSYTVAFDLSAADLRYASTKATGSPIAPSESAPEPVGASLINSIQKLGLRLEKREAPIDLIVVDQVNQTPTDN